MRSSRRPPRSAADIIALIHNIAAVLPAATLKEITQRVNARVGLGEGDNLITLYEVSNAVHHWRDPGFRREHRLEIMLDYVRGKVTDTRYQLKDTDDDGTAYFDPALMEDHDEGHFTAMRRQITFSKRMADQAASSAAAMTDRFLRIMWESVSDSHLAQARANEHILRGMEIWASSRRTGTGSGPTGSGPGSGGPRRRPRPGPLST